MRLIFGGLFLTLRGTECLYCAALETLLIDQYKLIKTKVEDSGSSAEEAELKQVWDTMSIAEVQPSNSRVRVADQRDGALPRPTLSFFFDRLAFRFLLTLGTLRRRAGTVGT